MPLRDPRHEAFCRNIVLLRMNNTEAYQKAGFTSKNKSNASSQSSKLRRVLEIQNRIVALSEIAIKQDLQTREKVHSQLQEIADRCMQAVPVVMNGKKTGEYKFDSQGANKALHLIGKDLGMFVDKVQVVDDELAKKTPEEVGEILTAAAIDLGRDFIKQLGEAVGLFETDGQTAAEAKAPTVEPVSTVQ